MNELENIVSFVQLKDYVSNLSSAQSNDGLIASKCALRFVELFQNLLNTKINQEKDGLTQNQEELLNRKKEASCAYDSFNKIALLPIPDNFKEGFLKLQPTVKEIADISNYTAGLNEQMQEILNKAKSRTKQNSGCMVAIVFLIVSTLCVFLV